MKVVIFGLTVSSSWGNGHATLWRGLIRALHDRGHQVHFFERDVPFYAAARDLTDLPGGTLHLYADWADALPLARLHLADADVAMITSYCPDAAEAGQVLGEARGLRVFYDMDSGVTVDRLRRGLPVSYIGDGGYRDFDLVLSYTGGRTAAELGRLLGARRVVPLYGSVDPERYRPVRGVDRYRSDLSYIGTYAADRQEAVGSLLLEPARRRTAMRFILAGSQYPDDFPWTDNLFYVRHLPQQDHPVFHCSARLSLNVTRAAMAAMGCCPAGRLFEAAACGAPLLTDAWDGIEEFFTPGSEAIVARTTDDVLAALDLPDEALRRIGEAGRERVLAEHTAAHRAVQFEHAVEAARSGETVNAS